MQNKTSHAIRSEKRDCGLNCRELEIGLRFIGGIAADAQQLRSIRINPMCGIFGLSIITLQNYIYPEIIHAHRIA